MTAPRRERLSEAQRSLLWYLARGYVLVQSGIGPSGACWLRVPKSTAELAVHHLVAAAAIRRGLVERIGDRSTLHRAYQLSAAGREIEERETQKAKG